MRHTGSCLQKEIKLTKDSLHIAVLALKVSHDLCILQVDIIHLINHDKHLQWRNLCGIDGGMALDEQESFLKCILTDPMKEEVCTFCQPHLLACV